MPTIHTSWPYPGRACLLGEHCDWYGGASLTVPLPMTVQVTAQPGPARLSIHAEMDGRMLHGSWDHPTVQPGSDPLRFAPAAAWFLQQQGRVLPNTHLEVRADLPTGRGFSSSAAFCLAVLDALALATGERPEPTRLAEWAFIVEHDLLGVACGRLDPLACVARRPVFLAWCNGRAPLQTVTVGRDLWLLVGAFSAPRDTPAILSALQQRPPAVDRALAIFNQATRTAARALEAGDIPALGAAMNAAQDAYEAHLLSLPALAAPQLVRACSDLRRWGAHGAKFSGAGGDGSVIALFDDHHIAEQACMKLRDRHRVATWVVPLMARA